MPISSRGKQVDSITYAAIAAFLPARYAKQACELSRAMSERFGSWYMLDIERFPPHVTLWLAYLPTKNIEALEASARKAAEQLLPLNIQLLGTQISSTGMASIDVDASGELVNAHKLLLAGLNELRDGYLHPKYRDKLDSLPKGQVASLTEFGTRFAGPTFSPHVTLGFADEQDVAQAKGALADVRGEFRLNELVLFKQAEEGRSIDILAHLP